MRKRPQCPSRFISPASRIRSRAERLLAVLDKAAAHAPAQKFDPAVYLTLRLRPDMLPFARQVQIVCDHAKNGSGAARRRRGAALRGQRGVAGRAQGAHRKDARLYRRRLDAKAIEAGAEREIAVPVGPNKVKMTATTTSCISRCRTSISISTTAYDMLRYAGVEIGKRDFLGAPPDSAA